MGVSDLDPDARGQRPWNAGNMIGANHPLKPRDVWAIRFFLDERQRLRNRATFDLAINSKLIGCDIVKMKIRTIVDGGASRTRATVIEQKTHRPVQFELMTDARETLLTWLTRRGGALDDFIFPSRVTFMRHPSTRQCARLVDEWVGAVDGTLPRTELTQCNARTIAHLQGDRQPAGRPNSARSRQHRKHRALLRSRYR